MSRRLRAKEQLLTELEAGMPGVTLAEDSEGLHKLLVISRRLTHRRERADLYASRAYQPRVVEGDRAAHAAAFARGELTVVVPRLVAGLREGWGETIVHLPQGSHRNVLDGETRQGGEVALADLLGTFPVAVLERGDV